MSCILIPPLGIYADLDDAPGPQFLNGSLITAETDSLFEQEGSGFPSQYFFAGEKTVCRCGTFVFISNVY